MGKLQTTEEFINNARMTHGDRYDYSQVIYTGNKNKVDIMCKVPGHGIFEQRPYAHVHSKQGCPKCLGGVRFLTRDFIDNAIAVHGNRYDYSMVKYKNSHSHVNIICHIHGMFKQIAKSHINNGNGCPRCGGRVKDNIDSFIEKARDKHGDKYDYSKVVYTESKEMIEILCPTHGTFKQIAHNHLKGHGCTKCAIDRRRL